jgi:hypothetical protein
MTKKTCCFVTIAVDAIHVPASRDGASPGFYHLAALALLIARRDPEGTWSFSIQRRATAAGEREDMLLAWATRNIPAKGILLGWQLAEAVMPPLFEAAADSDPVIGHAFIERLTSLLGAPSVDLAVPHGGAGAPPIDVVAASRGLTMRSLAPDEAESAWTVGDRERLQRHAESQAITAWRLWLAEAGSSAEPARKAFDSWLNA